jgi:hypothetical protein
MAYGQQKSQLHVYRQLVDYFLKTFLLFYFGAKTVLSNFQKNNGVKVIRGEIQTFFSSFNLMFDSDKKRTL